MSARIKLFLFSLLIVTSNLQAQYIPKFDVQGHRGARGLKPENTIPAFLAALNEGVTTIELDVAITKDQKVVISHEPWMNGDICFDSTGNVIPKKEEKKYNLYRMTYAEIKKFDCGSKGNERFPAQEKLKVSKPLLSEVIIAVENHIKNYTKYEVDYNIEIKSMPEGDGKFHPKPQEFSEIVYNLINQYLPLERVVIQSFDFRVLKYWHEKYPEVRLAALVENKNGVEQNLAALGFNPSIYSPYYKLLQKEDVKFLHKKKVRVIPWTVNKSSEMLSLKGMGVDGFITDYPDSARSYKMTLNIQPKNGSK
jgi:Glycerophosphoryl diester phosphodiesterase